jgi:hypothetical protein
VKNTTQNRTRVTALLGVAVALCLVVALSAALLPQAAQAGHKQMYNLPDS